LRISLLALRKRGDNGAFCAEKDAEISAQKLSRLFSRGFCHQTADRSGLELRIPPLEGFMRFQYLAQLRLGAVGEAHLHGLQEINPKLQVLIVPRFRVSRPPRRGKMRLSKYRAEDPPIIGLARV
jgi:hypothetical protein